MENAIVAGWKLTSSAPSTIVQQSHDTPSYWTGQPDTLISSANVRLVTLGSGLEVYNSILPALKETQSELIIVTCFWAKSDTLDELIGCLEWLSARGNYLGRKIRVRICFSSLSLLQKLFHTRSLEGRDYPQSEWHSKLGLPNVSYSGLDLQIKSIFVLPFSVMHPKFIIVDRKKVFLPSCNVSWEKWFEGCVEISGPCTDQFLYFYKTFWASKAEAPRIRPPTHHAGSDASGRSKVVFLPSPHHPWSILDTFRRPTSPATPLNLWTLESLRGARRSVYIQTPNLTARPVLEAILDALTRGVNIRLVTSERLMILEQLVTARTTTSRCVCWLLKKHRRLMETQHGRSRSSHDEEGQPTLGHLEIYFHTPRLDLDDDDPVQSHLKLMLVDDEIVLLGSGNMDRASWVTSQELGLAIIDSNFARTMKKEVFDALDGRLLAAVI